MSPGLCPSRGAQVTGYMRWEATLRWSYAAFISRSLAALGIGVLLIYSLTETAEAEKPRKQYWATSLTSRVDDRILEGLYDAVAHGAIGWLDVDPKYPIPPVSPGINLILYHVGGNCYIGADCDRFPSSAPTETDGTIPSASSISMIRRQEGRYRRSDYYGSKWRQARAQRIYRRHPP